MRHLALLAAACLGAAPAADAVAQGLRPDLSVILDGAYRSRALALDDRQRGFGLGHAELFASGNVDDRFYAQAVAALHSHAGQTELDLEEAFVETRGLRGGVILRAGRFLSQLGYLNSQHPHADDFADRPLPYRAFFGSHYSDDGVRADWVLPVPFYWRIGAEVLRGARLAERGPQAPAAGVFTLGTKIGGDIGVAHSWQAGIGFLRNRLPLGDHEHGHSHQHDAHDHHDHAHAHGARFTGRNLWIGDLVWKWAPGGNNRDRQLRLAAEYARVTDPSPYARSRDFHEGWYAWAVYRFHPQWEAGVRHGGLYVREPHGNHFHTGQLQETDVMLAWRHSHFSLVRLQYTQQRARRGFADAGWAVTLQFVVSLGSHGAHAF
ncbi:MAG TPA: hypothetical protein VM491_16970 [Burkholderiaceae bacterium]|nr:hypothetical protein [Burkholderiaceae bacterium]